MNIEASLVIERKNSVLIRTLNLVWATRKFHVVYVD